MHLINSEAKLSRMIYIVFCKVICDTDEFVQDLVVFDVRVSIGVEWMYDSKSTGKMRQIRIGVD